MPLEGIFRHPIFRGGEDPQNVASESENQEFLAKNLFHTNLVDETLKIIAVNGMNEKGSNFIPGVNLTEQELKALKATNNRKAKDAVFTKAKKQMEEKPSPANEAILGEVYKTVYSENTNDAKDPTGDLLNKLLDIGIERGSKVKQLRTNCMWFSPDDLKSVGTKIKGQFNEKFAETLGQQTSSGKPKEDIIAETLRVASIPCLDNPEKIMCFDSYALVQYLYKRLQSEAAGIKTGEALNVAIKRGFFTDSVPVPKEFQNCAGSKFLSDNQLLLVLRHYIAGLALEKLLPKLSNSDLQSILKIKDELVTISPPETAVGGIWHTLSLAKKRLVNNLPSSVNAVLAFSAIRWVACGLVRIMYTWSLIEKAGAGVIKTALKATIKPILRAMIEESKTNIKSESRSGKAEASSYLNSITKLTGISLFNHDAFNKAMALAESTTDEHIDKSIDVAVDVIITGLKAGFGGVIVHIVCSLKTAFFGELVTKFYDFCKGFMENPVLGWNTLYNFSTQSFSTVSSWLGLDILGQLAKSTNFLVNLRTYLNPNLTRVETAELAAKAIGNAASWFPGGTAVSTAIFAIRQYLPYANFTAMVADAQRVYLPTLQYISAQLTAFIPANGEFPKWGDIDAGSVSFLIVQFLPRMCGLLKLTGNILLFDVSSIKSTWVTNIFKLKEYLPEVIKTSVDAAAVTAKSYVALTQTVLPAQAAVGLGLKAYTTSIKGKSICESFAENVGWYINVASIAVLVWQIGMDLGTIAYLYKYNELPPVHYQSKCIKTFANQDQINQFFSKATISDDAKRAIADKTKQAFEQDARKHLGAFEREEDIILAEKAKKTKGWLWGGKTKRSPKRSPRSPKRRKC